MTPRIVGWSGIYLGATHASLHGHRVRIVAVLKEVPAPEGMLRVTSNEELAALGGLDPMIGSTSHHPWVTAHKARS